MTLLDLLVLRERNLDHPCRLELGLLQRALELPQHLLQPGAFLLGGVPVATIGRPDRRPWALTGREAGSSYRPGKSG